MFFQQIISKYWERKTLDLSNLISKEITIEKNENIVWVPIELELSTTLKTISSSSSLGLDGFRSIFYISCWDIVKNDLLEVARDFFIGYKFPKFYTSFYIVLIPKVKNLLSFDKFRPINLCLVVYKIFSKIIVSQLTSHLNCIISLEQEGFLLGRSIFDNITIVYKMVHSGNRKSKGGNVILKIDMSKTYDRVNWGFLKLIM